MNSMQVSKKILQIKIPKTASSSIEEGVIRLCRKAPVQKFRSFGHGNPVAQDYPNCFVIVSVRNPYDRLLSAYRYIIENKKGKPDHKYIFDLGTFENFALSIAEHAYKNTFFYPQVKWLVHNNDPAYNFIMRYETLQDDWDRFVARYTKIKIKLPHIRPSKHIPWNQMYNQKMRDAVYDVYKSDFDLLNYPA